MAEGGKGKFSGKIKGAVQELAQDVATLCVHPVYVSTVAGQTLYTGDSSSLVSKSISHKFTALYRGGPLAEAI